MVVNARSLKRMKRRVTADLDDLLSFPSPAIFPISDGPFRSNVRVFLTRHALLLPPSSLFPQLLTWQVLFHVGALSDDVDSPATVCLDVVEEDVARSRSVYCDQCRVVGWSGHPVCTKRYHFIVKADGNSISGPVKACPKCGDEVNIAEPRCETCNHVMTSDDVENSVYQQLEGATHLLHGVIHANGYGHLLRVNGREGGSRVLSGSHIMNFWDRLCKYLGVRLGLLIVYSALSFLYLLESKRIGKKNVKEEKYEFLAPFLFKFFDLLYLLFARTFVDSHGLVIVNIAV